MRKLSPYALALLLLCSGAKAQVDMRQVQISVYIMETDERGLRDIGTNLAYTRYKNGVEAPTGVVQQVDTRVTDPSNPAYSVTMPAPDAGLFPNQMRPDQNAGAAGLQTQSGAGMEFTIIGLDKVTIDGVFRSIERKSEVDLVSKPELMVVNGRTAEIHAGGEVPFQDIQYNNRGIPQLNVKWQPIGVNMNLTPMIVSDDMVQINMTKLEVSDISRIESLRGIDLPVFSTREQSGNVQVPNGDTLVIGGLSSKVVRKTERRVPILGRLPIVGIPFRGRTSEADTTRLLIFLSPTIVDIRQRPERVLKAMNFWNDREWKYREQISDEMATMANDH